MFDPKMTPNGRPTGLFGPLRPKMAILTQNGQFGQNGQIGSKWAIEAQMRPKMVKNMFLWLFMIFWDFWIFLIFDPKMTPNDHPTGLFGPLRPKDPKIAKITIFAILMHARRDLNRARDPHSRSASMLQVWSSNSMLVRTYVQVWEGGGGGCHPFAELNNLPLR